MFPLGVLKKPQVNVLLDMPFSDLTGISDLSTYNRAFTAEFGDPAVVSDALFLENDVLSTADVSGLDLLGSDFTLQFFVEFGVSTGTLRGLFGISSGTTALTAGGFRAYIDNTNKLVFQMQPEGVGAITVSLITPSALALNTRTKVAIVKVGGISKMYINDVLVVSAPIALLKSFAAATHFKFGLLVAYSGSSYARLTKLDGLLLTREVLYF